MKVHVVIYGAAQDELSAFTRWLRDVGVSAAYFDQGKSCPHAAASTDVVVQTMVAPGLPLRALVFSVARSERWVVVLQISDFNSSAHFVRQLKREIVDACVAGVS